MIEVYEKLRIMVEHRGKSREECRTEARRER